MQLELANDIIIQGHRIELRELKLNVYTVTGAQDDLEVQNIQLEVFSLRSFHTHLTAFICEQS